MSYAVKEIFFTLQGEGANAGRPSVFCRFSGCNLWTGRESDRHRAICQFCDTDFVGTNGTGGGKFANAEDLADAILNAWPHAARKGDRFVVCTGGEPLLQVDEPLLESLHARHFTVAIETNGTQPGVHGLDWICVSPKSGTDLRLHKGNELKLVYPQPGAAPESFEHLEFDHFFLQPMDGPEVRLNTARAMEYCLAHPQWRLSIQTHKILGIR